MCGGGVVAPSKSLASFDDQLHACSCLTMTVFGSEERHLVRHTDFTVLFLLLVLISLSAKDRQFESRTMVNELARPRHDSEMYS